jgi:hypothetical protein
MWKRKCLCIQVNARYTAHDNRSVKGLSLKIVIVKVFAVVVNGRSAGGPECMDVELIFVHERAGVETMKDVTFMHLGK